MKPFAVCVVVLMVVLIETVSAETREASEAAPETSSAVVPPETAPETVPETAVPSETLPETVPETSPESAPVGIERVPPESGTKKGIAFATGAGCEPRPDGTASGYSLLLEITGEEGAVCGTKIEITNVKQRRIFSHTIPSSWIYLDLPPGGYDVEVKRPKGPWHKLSTQTTAGRLQKGRVFLTP